MRLPEGMTKDALLIKYYKMNSKGSEQLYGTEKAVTVAVSSQTAAQVVSIKGLDSGSKYGVRCTLRVSTESAVMNVNHPIVNRLVKAYVKITLFFSFHHSSNILTQSARL